MDQKILFVDDEPYFSESLVEALRDNGFLVQTAENASAAISILQDKAALPDLIILDIIMPVGSLIQDSTGGRRAGLRVHEFVRKQLNLRLPIIFLSVADDPVVEREIENIEKSTRVNNYSYLVKPVLPTELLEKVSLMMQSVKK